MMADLLREPVPARARPRNRSVSVRAAPNAPILRKPRRETPSQNCCLEPHRVNMTIPPFGRNTELGGWKAGCALIPTWLKGQEKPCTVGGRALVGDRRCWLGGYGGRSNLVQP